MGVIGAVDTKRKLEEQRRNMEAEGRRVRQWIWDTGEDVAEDDEMGDNIYLGDVTTSTTSMPQTASKGMSTLAALGLAAAGLGIGAAAPILAYNLTKPDQGKAVDTDTQYGLKIYREE